MRLKTFVGPSMADVMGQVRRELGAEAIIVSRLDERGGGVRVTAALERQDVDPAPPPPADALAAVGRVLDYHGVPLDLATRLNRAAALVDRDAWEIVLAAALDETFRFSPVAGCGDARPIMLIGPNGMGKTATTAKLAAQRCMRGQPVTVISTDTARAAGTEQLAAFIRILGFDLETAETPEALARAVAARPAGQPAFVDSAGLNPFDAGEMSRLGEFAAAAHAEPVLVLAAGLDAIEAADVARACRAVSASRLMTSRVDSARRLGGLLAAADAGDLMIGEIGVTPHIADGLSPLNPVSLARLLSRDPLEVRRDPCHTEAAE